MFWGGNYFLAKNYVSHLIILDLTLGEKNNFPLQNILLTRKYYFSRKKYALARNLFPRQKAFHIIILLDLILGKEIYFLSLKTLL